MQSDDVELVLGLVQGLGDGTGDEGVGQAVETVLAQLVVLGDFLVDRIGADVLGDGAVEGRVEEGNVGRGGQVFMDRLYNRQGTCIVPCEGEEIG